MRWYFLVLNIWLPIVVKKRIYASIVERQKVLVSLLNDSLKNKVLLVSASASIESPLTTHNLQWLEKKANLPIESELDS